VTVNGEFVTDHDAITKLILTSKYTPGKIDIQKYVCPNCKLFLSEDHIKIMLVKEV